MFLLLTRNKLYLVFVGLLVYIFIGILYFFTLTIPDQSELKDYKLSHRRFTGQKGKAYDIIQGLKISTRRQKVHWCQPLRFIVDSKRPTIALVSFPGSGNTWLRYILQQATGINTGSVYKDFGLFKNGFPGECVYNSSVSVVKTHERGPQAHQGYSKAVLLVRDPSQAIQAEFNRQGGGHIGFAPPQRYKLRNGKYWEKFVDEQIIKWKNTNLDWLYNFKKPILIIFYDELVNDLETNLRELLNFIELNVTEAALKCALTRREGIYRRKKRLFVLDPFTPEMKTKIANIKEDVYGRLYEYIQNHKEKWR